MQRTDLELCLAPERDGGCELRPLLDLIIIHVLLLRVKTRWLAKDSATAGHKRRRKTERGFTYVANDGINLCAVVSLGL